jgi:DNA replicative helicase MCM subunit Mcm2 (Cdc46/Mcm family)
MMSFNRLIITALQAVATDPTTGKLDLDLLATGFSHRDRVHQGELRIAIGQLVEKMQSPSMKFAEAFQLFKQATGKVRFIHYSRV